MLGKAFESRENRRPDKHMWLVPNRFPLAQCTISATVVIIFLDFTIEEDLSLMVMPFRAHFVCRKLKWTLWHVLGVS